MRSPQCPCSPIGTAQSTDCALSSDVSEWLPIECDLSEFPQGAGERIAAQLDKGQALDLRWTIIGLFISVVRGSATRRDPQALSTLWIVIIRQHWRKSMLHSASFLS